MRLEVLNSFVIMIVSLSLLTHIILTADTRANMRETTTLLIEKVKLQDEVIDLLIKGIK